MEAVKAVTVAAKENIAFCRLRDRKEKKKKKNLVRFFKMSNSAFLETDYF